MYASHDYSSQSFRPGRIYPYSMASHQKSLPIQLLLHLLAKPVFWSLHVHPSVEFHATIATVLRWRLLLQTRKILRHWGLQQLVSEWIHWKLSSHHLNMRISTKYGLDILKVRYTGDTCVKELNPSPSPFPCGTGLWRVLSPHGVGLKLESEVTGMKNTQIRASRHEDFIRAVVVDWYCTVCVLVRDCGENAGKTIKHVWSAFPDTTNPMDL